MRAMRQERCANWRRISLRASSTMARYAYTAPVKMPNSRYLREMHVRSVSRRLGALSSWLDHVCNDLVENLAAGQSQWCEVQALVQNDMLHRLQPLVQSAARVQTVQCDACHPATAASACTC
jgi:hypothetical protein